MNLPSSTAYDDAFLTLLHDCPHLIIPVVNMAFTKNYTGQEKVNFSPNEFFLNQSGGGEEKRITDACFFIVDKDGIAKRYHIECESNLDTTILLRIFEYDTQISLHDAKTDGNTIIVPFPLRLCLLCVRKRQRQMPSPFRL